MKFLNPSKLEKLNEFLKKQEFKYVLKEFKSHCGDFEFKLANKDDKTLSASCMSDGEQVMFTYSHSSYFKNRSSLNK